MYILAHAQSERFDVFSVTDFRVVDLPETALMRVPTTSFVIGLISDARVFDDDVKRERATPFLFLNIARTDWTHGRCTIDTI